MTRRHPAPLALAVVLALTGAALCGALVPSPADGPPAYALHTLLVWRLEVATAVAAALYTAIATVVLALEGQLLTRIGTTGLDLPPRRPPASPTGTPHERREWERTAQEKDKHGGKHQLPVKHLRLTKEPGYGDEHERDDDRPR